MSDREKRIAETVAAAVPKMNDFTKGYLLGQVEAMARRKEKEGGDEGGGEKLHEPGGGGPIAGD